MYGNVRAQVSSSASAVTAVLRAAPPCVGRCATLHALLAAFFAVGAMQYCAQWRWSRAERVPLLFALHGLLGASLSLALLVLGQATSLAEAQLALGARTTIALVW